MNKYLFFIGRYLAYFFLGLEIILLPYILPSKVDYGNLEYFKAFLSLLPLLLIGFQSGFLHLYYIKKNDLTTSLLIGGTILMFPIALVSAVYFQNILMFFACLASGYSIFLEKVFQKNNMLLRAIFFKPIVSIFNIILIYLLIVIFKIKLSLTTLICISYIFSIFVYAFPAISKTNFKFNFKDLIKDIKLLIYHGFWLNLSTMCVNIFLFTDRTFIKNYDQIILADYSFAYNVCQVLFVFFTSLSYFNEVKLGENIASFRIIDFNKSLFKVFFYFFIGFIVLGIGFSIIIRFFPLFSESKIYFVLIGLTWGVFFASSSLGVISQYIGIQKKMSLFLLLITIINCLFYFFNNAFNLLISPQIWVLKSGIMILLFSFFQINRIRNKLA